MLILYSPSPPPDTTSVCRRVRLSNDESNAAAGKWNVSNRRDLTAASPSARTASARSIECNPVATALARLDQVIEDDTDYDEDFLPPAASVMEDARELVASSYALCSSKLPSIHPAPLGDGGLFMRWKHTGNEVRVTIPPVGDGPSRLYFSIGDDDGVTSDVQSADLAHWLDRLVSG